MPPLFAPAAKTLVSPHLVINKYNYAYQKHDVQNYDFFFSISKIFSSRLLKAYVSYRVRPPLCVRRYQNKRVEERA
ncbi:MAG: hypothetical protein HYX67_09225 [Candidatus Melainabacteria bacterium]|nr:hypothetical protein [Candidatus Melainabacteria bacterium]